MAIYDAFKSGNTTSNDWQPQLMLSADHHDVQSVSITKVPHMVASTFL